MHPRARVCARACVRACMISPERREIWRIPSRPTVRPTTGATNRQPSKQTAREGASGGGGQTNRTMGALGDKPNKKTHTQTHHHHALDWRTRPRREAAAAQEGRKRKEKKIHQNDAVPLHAVQLLCPLDERIHDAAEEVSREPLPHDARAGVVLGQHALHAQTRHA